MCVGGGRYYTGLWLGQGNEFGGGGGDDIGLWLGLGGREGGRERCQGCVWDQEERTGGVGGGEVGVR